ncbi:MAG: enoyl-CoA hydratase/isomerase family protein [Rhodobacteraceae bacterium]|nr:enoyl-CoA hydratase/isomerase family protein [Paracoccaceae bacterium]
MEPELLVRTEGRAGRLTLNRPKALNALTHAQCLETTAALTRWRHDPSVDLVILDATGDRAFCAGGDIAYMYEQGRAGNFDAGRAFWRDEYRMNALLAGYHKPVISFLHGFVMGGGVGYGCHASHRVVAEDTQISMPECGIGLVPDVGGSRLLARAPGRLGLHLGLTGARMGPGDALFAGFADHFIPRADWPAVIARLCETGDAAGIAAAAQPAPDSPLAAATDLQAAYDAPGTGAAQVAAIMGRLAEAGGDGAAQALKALKRNSPLSLACAATMIGALGPEATIRDALRAEFRWVWRSMERGDFLEGIRAAIIDKDRSPRWRHAGIERVTEAEVAEMLAPLGADDLTFEEEQA